MFQGKPLFAYFSITCCSTSRIAKMVLAAILSLLKDYERLWFLCKKMIELMVKNSKQGHWKIWRSAQGKAEYVTNMALWFCNHQRNFRIQNLCRMSKNCVHCKIDYYFLHYDKSCLVFCLTQNILWLLAFWCRELYMLCNMNDLFRSDNFQQLPCL